MATKKYFELGNIEHSLLASKVEENNYDYNPEKYIFDPNLKNDSHAAIVRQITEKSTVLDIGCASGIIGSILSKYKNCVVDGIEYDKKAAKVASSKKIYRDVFNFSITDVTSKEYKDFMQLNRKYDYVIFADVLEHLVNPWDAIINTSKLLKKGGSIVISIPNISHIDIIKAIIDGDFNYANHGILDSTHLRFFTAKSFVQMIENIEKESRINFSIEFCEAILFKPPYFEDDRYFKLFNLDGKLEDYLCLQNIFKLTPVAKKVNNKLEFVDHAGYFDTMCEYIKTRDKEIEELKHQLAAITGSRSWKIANRISRIFHKKKRCD